MGGSPINKDSHSDDLHKSKDESPVSSIIGLLILISVLCAVVFMFKDQIKEWLGKNKKIILSDDILPESNDETKNTLPMLTEEIKIELQPETISTSPTQEIKFEIQQPQLTEIPETTEEIKQ